ncbi:MAG: N-acetyltransferase [Clostridia bacterium]|nr:N-acetyltransferase [Clostridia bacterium]
MNHFEWQDYTKEDAALVDSWLDADTVRMTGMDEGFDAFHQYWKNESSPERGEYFWSKLVSENGHPFAVISYGYCNGTVTIMEIVVDPAVRGQGKGTAVISEFLNNAAAWIAQPITVFNAVVFQRNTASQIAFYKAGFVLEAKDQERWKRTVNDSEILFRYTKRTLPSFSSTQIRWLGPDERRLFNAHLRLCSQNTLSIQKWNGIMKTGVRYCGLFIDNKMVARACIEILTDRYWEISDVRVAKDHRNRGYATTICGFVANEIIKSGRIPTIRTEKTNNAMLKVIEKLHFHPFDNKPPDSCI